MNGLSLTQQLPRQCRNSPPFLWNSYFHSTIWGLLSKVISKAIVGSKIFWVWWSTVPRYDSDSGIPGPRICVLLLADGTGSGQGFHTSLICNWSLHWGYGCQWQPTPDVQTRVLPLRPGGCTLAHLCASAGCLGPGLQLQREADLQHHQWEQHGILCYSPSHR